MNRSDTPHCICIEVPAKVGGVITGRYADSALRLQEHMLGGRCTVGAVNNDISFIKTGSNITFFNLDMFQQIAIRAALMHNGDTRPECRYRISNRSQHLVVHLDQFQRLCCNTFTIRGDNRHRVPAVTHLVTTQYRPVKIDYSVKVATGDILVS